ncbi:MAG: choice-of-anchor I family protein [Methylococcaceae bacterium]
MWSLLRRRYFQQPYIIAVVMISVLMMAILSAPVSAGVQLQPIGTYATNIFAGGAAEIVAHDPKTQRLFVVNADAQGVDAIDISDPTNPKLSGTFDVTPYGNQANSIAVHNGVCVAAVEASPKQNPGRAVFFDTTSLTHLSNVVVGALPDMVTYTPDGRYVLLANEGEPADDYSIDPEGSISIIDLRSTPIAALTQSNVATADFTAFNSKLLHPSVRVFSPGATAAQDFEPEYISVFGHGPNNWKAMVTLQENNALALVDITQAKVKKVLGLGFKNHNLARNAIDASNEDNGIKIDPWPVHGMYQPDTIASFQRHGRTYFVTANEGDSRDYSGFSEEERVKDLRLDPDRFPNAAILQSEEKLGRLKVTNTLGDFDNDGDFDALFSYGARSFSIWSIKHHGRNRRKMKLIYDSGSDLEHITSSQLPANFNSDDEEISSFDDRSDDKGPEPEGVTLSEINGRIYAFVGLERIGGVIVYDVTNPRKPFFIQYVNTRDFSVVAGAGSGGDMSPEGMVFIKAADSPNGSPLLVVSYEVSGTTTIFNIND